MSRWQRHGEQRAMPVGLERGRDGFVAAWALDLPGCYALVPPGLDPIERINIAMLEFTAWGHNRSADRASVDDNSAEVVQTVDTGDDLRGGDTTAFFLHDAEPPGPKEFPLWANPHDRALDELRDLALSLPRELQDLRLDAEGRTLIGVVQHCAATERFYANQLGEGSARQPKDGPDPSFRELQEAHMWLQQVLCDVPAALRIKRPSSALHEFEEWSVRKVMRRSIWHLRYHTWELRRSIGGIWLD
ncbi:MAG: DinB family protein [Tepidiformaceae bacterium]